MNFRAWNNTIAKSDEMLTELLSKWNSYPLSKASASNYKDATSIRTEKSFKLIENPIPRRILKSDLITVISVRLDQNGRMYADVIDEETEKFQGEIPSPIRNFEDKIIPLSEMKPNQEFSEQNSYYPELNQPNFNAEKPYHVVQDFSDKVNDNFKMIEQKFDNTQKELNDNQQESNVHYESVFDSIKNEISGIQETVNVKINTQFLEINQNWNNLLNKQQEALDFSQSLLHNDTLIFESITKLEQSSNFNSKQLKESIKSYIIIVKAKRNFKKQMESVKELKSNIEALKNILE
jgi:hypothetical protein